MSQQTGNLLNCPTFKIEDRKAILNRVLEALQNLAESRYHFKGSWIQPTAEELANWDARFTVDRLLRSFPITSGTLDRSTLRHLKEDRSPNQE